MGRTPSAAADDDDAPTTTTASSYGLAADCPVTWSDDAMLMTSSLCYGDEMTPEPGSVMAERNWRVVPLVALVAAGVLGNTLVCVSVSVERRLHSVTNYFLVSLADSRYIYITFV